MPETDGIELIMALGRLQQPRLIAMSAGDRLGGRPTAAGRPGAVRTLSKPFDMQALLELVTEVLAA
jgi:CheY-like chemotaxis protein